MSFYIEKVIVTGSGKTDSVIELSKGINIIYGPSNTGKTYIVKCIDFMFGSKTEPIDTSTGYDNVKIIVKTDRGELSMIRKIGENKIHIDSNDNRIISGDYNTRTSQKNYDKTINSVWLCLIGINEMHQIIKNDNFHKQVLSWKTFKHIFMLTETKIISEYPTLLTGQYTSNTVEIASLIFLMFGEDFANSEKNDSKAVKEAKKKAVKDYINKELFRLSERNQKLQAQVQENSKVNIEEEIKDVIAKISELELEIATAIAENQNILSELHTKNEDLAECSILLDRYEELTTQYAADLKRLNFIIDGEVNFASPGSTKCPFCDNKINVNKNYTYINAAKSEFKKIKLQEKDLEEALQALRVEKNRLEQEIKVLIEKKASSEKIIETELQPQLNTLTEKMSVYKAMIELDKEIDIIKSFSDQKVADIIDNESNEESEIKFKVKDHIEYNFISDLGNNILSFLQKCKYENLLSVIFDKSSMDIIVNGKKKGANGKGYNAFFNSIVAVVLSRYMKDKAKFPPNFLILDSPTLSLKEKAEVKPSETMRNAFFEEIIHSPEGIQVIIVENEIPSIDYKNVNKINFSKEKDRGRYGFLLDVTD